MTADIIDGKAFAATVRARVAGQVARLKAAHGITPGLALVLAGEDPASQVSGRSSGEQSTEPGTQSLGHTPGPRPAHPRRRAPAGPSGRRR